MVALPSCIWKLETASGPYNAFIKIIPTEGIFVECRCKIEIYYTSDHEWNKSLSYTKI